MEVANGGGKVDVVLGVNGYVWISKHVESSSSVGGVGGAAGGADEAGKAGAAGAATAGITNMEEMVSATMYSSQNDRIEPETMREIARLRGVVTALVENGLRVDEEMVTRGYHEAVEMALVSADGPEDIYLGGEKGQQLAAVLRGT